jgi:REP element-mobilizing transposase RayT
MPRAARRKSETGIYHIMLREVNKQDLFEDDTDRLEFMNAIFRYKQTSDIDLYAYCLMSNHVHLLLKEKGQNTSTFVKQISSSYVYYFNSKYARTGHLFQERYKSEPVEDDDYFLIVLRYIHQNPVKATIVSSVEEYKWSSYSDYLKKQRIDYELAMNLFKAYSQNPLDEFIRYNNLKNQDECLEIKTIKQKSDDEIRETLLKISGFNHVNEIQYAEKEKRKEIIGQLKSEGASIRQLQRITGLSYKVVREA